MKEFKLGLKIALGILASISVMLAVQFYISGHTMLLNDSKESLERLSFVGQFYSGAVVSCLTFATVIFVILAFWNQSETSKIQRIANQLQSDDIKRSQFVNNYFKMLDLHQTIVNGLYLTYVEPGQFGGYRTLYKRDVFYKIYNDISKTVKSNIEDIERLENLQLAYDSVDYVYNSVLGNYFRNLYLILKYIDTNEDINKNENNYYGILIRAQLTKYERLVLFYNGLSDFGYKSFKPLLEKYGFFKHLYRYELLSPEEYNMYDIKAYDFDSEKPMG